MSRAHDIIKQLEEHVGSRVESRRLRFHLVETLRRAYDDLEELQTKISAVLDGQDVFDPKKYKAIRRSKGENS